MRLLREVKDVRKVCQLMERCDGYGGMDGVWEGVITFRKCENHQGGEKGVTKVCQVMYRCDGDINVLGQV